jgi:hypothetical protein
VADAADCRLPLLAAGAVVRSDLDDTETVDATAADVDQLREDLIPARERGGRIGGRVRAQQIRWASWIN